MQVSTLFFNSEKQCTMWQLSRHDNHLSSPLACWSLLQFVARISCLV